jgi:hypothetical protein
MTEQGAAPRAPQDKRAVYAAYLAKKAETAPDSGVVYIAASEAEEIALLLRACK